MDDKEQHIAEVFECNGRRSVVLDSVRAAKGWVVTSQVPNGFWERCKTYAYPIRPIKVLGFIPTPATREYARWVTRYGEGIMAVLIPDEETFEGYSGGPILLDDLNRDPMVLLDESMVSVVTDTHLSNMKRRTAMLLLGWADTK